LVQAELLRTSQASVKSARDARHESDLREAASLAVAAAAPIYRSAVQTVFQQAVTDEFKRYKKRAHLDYALRVRYSPNPDFVPEVVDKLNAGLEGVFEYRVAGKANGGDGVVQFDARGVASFSAFPVADCVVDPSCDAKPALLLDGTASASFKIAGPAASRPTRITLAGVGRVALLNPDRVVTVDGADGPEWSVGGVASVAHPITEDLSMVGSATFRWASGTELGTTTSVSIAKDF
jgi:hypothetical protein